MSRTTIILAVIYFFIVEFVIFCYSPRAVKYFSGEYRLPEVNPRIVAENKVSPDYSGEEIVYDVKMGSMKIGTSTFRHEGRMQLDGKTMERVVFVTKVVQVNDTETIWADPADFLPARVERDIMMWPKHEKIIEVYDQAGYTLDISKSNGQEAVIRIIRKSPIHNAILLPYHVRRVEKLEPGWSMNVVLPTQEFKINLVGTEEVQVPAGTFKAYYFESEPKRFSIWISADERRIPVKIKGSSGLNYTMLMRSYGKK